MQSFRFVYRSDTNNNWHCFIDILRQEFFPGKDIDHFIIYLITTTKIPFQATIFRGRKFREICEFFLRSIVP